MSKLYSIYLSEKEKDKTKIILFKSGIFYLAIDNDAIFLSNNFGFKLTNLNNKIKKCGFPCNSLEKYSNLFNNYNINIKIIDIEKNTNYCLSDYKLDKTTKEIIDLIKNVDINNLSIIEAYNFIENLQKKLDENM